MKNGLFSIHVALTDGRTGKGSGVIIFQNGQLLGGDAYLYYTGSYTVREDNSTMKGEVIVNRHTPSPDAQPLFGSQQVSIGWSGSYTDTRGTMEGIALVGRNSVMFRATLRRLADAG
jgi:hypothetical protein